MLLTGCAAAAPAAPGTVPPPATASSSSSPGQGPSLDDVRSLLERRGVAVRDGDRDAVAATEIAGAVSPVRDRATALPLAVWRYDGLEVSAATGGLHEVRARLTYRLDRDPSDVEVDVRLGLRDGPAGWRVASERVEGRPEVWELGEVAVVPDGAALVVAVGGARTSAARVAAAADTAVRDVDRAWGAPWQRSAVVVLVPGPDELARGLGRTAADLQGVGAVTAPAGRGAEPSTRVWTSAAVVDALAEVELGVLLRHETVHVASGSVLAPGVPAWLVEGMAEEIGYGDAVPLRVACGAFLAAVARDGAPEALPTTDDLSGPGLAVGYGGAHVAADLVVRDHGVAGLTRLYRLVHDGDGGDRLGIDDALRSVTGSGIAAFTAAWRARALALAA